MATKSKDSFLRTLQCTTRFEDIARNEHGATRIGGIDECARGNWAAETCASCVILPESLPPELDGKLRGSKLIGPKKRAALAELIKEHAVAWNVATISSEIIDSVGIHNAAIMAMEFAVHGLSVVPYFLLIDSVKIDFDLPQLAINHGDALSVSIAAQASWRKLTIRRSWKSTIANSRNMASFGTKDMEPGSTLRQYGSMVSLPYTAEAFNRLGTLHLEEVRYQPV